MHISMKSSRDCDCKNVAQSTGLIYWVYMFPMMWRYIDECFEYTKWFCLYTCYFIFQIIFLKWLISNPIRIYQHTMTHIDWLFICYLFNFLSIQHLLCAFFWCIFSGGILYTFDTHKYVLRPFFFSLNINSRLTIHVFFCSRT